MYVKKYCGYVLGEESSVPVKKAKTKKAGPVFPLPDIIRKSCRRKARFSTVLEPPVKKALEHPPGILSTFRRGYAILRKKQKGAVPL